MAYLGFCWGQNYRRPTVRKFVVMVQVHVSTPNCIELPDHEGFWLTHSEHLSKYAAKQSKQALLQNRPENITVITSFKS